MLAYVCKESCFSLSVKAFVVPGTLNTQPRYSLWSTVIGDTSSLCPTHLVIVSGLFAPVFLPGWVLPDGLVPDGL